MGFGTRKRSGRESKKGAMMFFKSSEHKSRFLAAMQDIGKVYSGKLDVEYSSALYILTASLSTWERVSGYVGHDGIDFPAMLAEVHFSSGITALVSLAGNLFNSTLHVDPVELMLLDDGNFSVALTALVLRRKSHHIDEFK